MPVTARRLLVRNIDGSGKKTPSYSYSPTLGRLVNKACMCLPISRPLPEPISETYTIPGTYTYTLPTLPAGKSWSVSYELLGGGGGGGGGGSNVDIFFNTFYGSSGQPGGDSSLILGTFTTNQTSLTIIVGDSGDGGDVDQAGQSAGNSFISDGVNSGMSIGGTIGIPGIPGFSLTFQTAIPVSGNPGTGGKGGDSNSPGSKGYSGYVNFTATVIP